MDLSVQNNPNSYNKPFQPETIDVFDSCAHIPASSQDDDYTRKNNNRKQIGLNRERTKRVY